MAATLSPADARPVVGGAVGDHTATGLSHILAPKSVAVIGASRRPGTMGHQVLQNLLTHGFMGAAYPVNPFARAICGVRAYPSVAAIGEPIDLAVVVVPHPKVLEVVTEACDAGAKALVVISAGFCEVGEAGAARERQLTEFVRGRGVRMVGPNCMGVVNADPAVSMNATFATVMPPFGHSAFVSQSGALGLNVLDHAREYGIGISQFVSVGNKPDVSGNDLLLEWEHDDAVRVILMYVESFGNPQRFLQAARRITKHKPIIVVKSGRSRAGARAASSHTGALAVNDTAVDAMLTQAGVLRASSIEELFDMAMAFGARALPASRRVGVLTNAGGPGILAADAMDAAGAELADLSPETVATLRPLFPAEASIRNPLDMVASARPTGYTLAMQALLADPAIDTVVPIFVPPFGVKQVDVADAIVTAAASNPSKPVLAVLMGREGLAAGREQLRRVGIPTFIFPESAARAASALIRHASWAKRPVSAVQRYAVDLSRARGLIDGARREHRELLNEAEALQLLRAYGIEAADARVATNEVELRHAARELGFPLVMKVMSPDISHKSDVGGVITGLCDEAEVSIAYGQLRNRVHDSMPVARVTGVLLQRMAGPGREFIIGATRDPRFGALVMFGLGGVMVEVLHDTVFRMAPLTPDDANEMLASIRGAKLLDAFRGAPPVDRAALADALCRVSQMMDELPDIAELDVNPVQARPSGVLALDVRVRLAVGGA